MIEWTDETWNPVRGCSRVSEGCRHCYAETMAGRIVAMGRGKPTAYDGLVKVPKLSGVTMLEDARWTGAVAFDAAKLAEPLRRRKPTRYFVNSMSDLFHDGFTDEQIAAVFGVMAACPQHTFIVLTKRAKRMREWFEWVEREEDGHPLAVLHVEAGPHIADAIGSGDVDDGPAYAACETILDSEWPLPNAWLGVSVENQEASDERIPELLRTPAAVRFLSCEPLLGPVQLGVTVDGRLEFFDYGIGGAPRISWVIAGCESGRGARECDVNWLRSLRDQCADAQVPFFLKQARADELGYGGEAMPVTTGTGSTRKPGGAVGRGIIELPYLDGVQHAAMPEVAK